MKVLVAVTNEPAGTAYEMTLDLPALMAFGPAALKILLEPPDNVVTLTAVRGP